MATPVAFVPVVRQRLSDELVRRIGDSIENGQLSAGEQLPPIAQMARTFRVAGTTVREALMKLEAMRLVEIRHGIGVYVSGARASAKRPNIRSSEGASTPRATRPF